METVVLTSFVCQKKMKNSTVFQGDRIFWQCYNIMKKLNFLKKVLERVYKRKNSAIIKARVAQTVARQKKIFKGESHEGVYQTTL